MESPTIAMHQPEQAMDTDEAVYPCKGCGDILEEGKAFELAGNRWHIDCFRCNTCGVLLDSDANLLLLGDGSLICNNCTYSCHNCGNKIEDLAILTGDLAYCAQCFKCRNCKRKIENLRYAKTSQGIFCMQCHETLMARRRKKARENKERREQPQREVSSQSNGGSAPVVLDKSLPALPPAPVAPVELPATTSSRSPPTGSNLPRGDSYSSNYNKSQFSPSSLESSRENTTLPSSTYSDGRTTLNEMDFGGLDDSPFIPIALDTGTGSPFSPPKKTTASPEPLASAQRDYFGLNKSPLQHREDLGALRDDSRSSSKDRVPFTRQSPHIASLEKGRRSYTDGPESLVRSKESDVSTPASNMSPPTDRSRALGASPREVEDQLREEFKLQEAPKKRPTSMKSSSAASPDPETSPTMNLAGQTTGSPIIGTEILPEAPRGTPLAPLETQQPKEYSSKPFRKSPMSPTGSSLSDKTSIKNETVPAPLATGKASVPARKELPSDTTIAIPPHERKLSATGTAGKPVSKAVDSLKKVAPDIPPARSPNRPVSAIKDGSEDLNASRSGTAAGHKGSESLSSLSNELNATPKYPPSPQLSRELSGEDEVRDLPGEDDDHGGLLRKVSKAVRHGRSQSDKAGQGSPRWARTPRNGSLDIGSPTAATPDTKEESLELRNKLKFAQQKIAELETEKATLEEKINGTVDIRQVNTELREKRSTMAFLDTQREMVARELEVMTEHLSKAKDSNQPLNIDALKSDVMRDFATSLQKLKEQLGAQIEDLVHKKNELTGEISNLIQMKDKGFQEYESLSSKNSQLVELNHSLVQNIQDLYKQGRQPNGLGIYTQADLQKAMSVDTTSSFSGDTVVEHGEMVQTPKVVDIRKGQVKKFNWKKGGSNMVKNMKQGFKDAIAEKNQPARDYYLEGTPYGQVAAGDAPMTGSMPLAPSKGQVDPTKQSWGGFLSAQRPKQGAGSAKDSREASVTNLPAETCIFGSDLSARADFEKRIVPTIVTRCIEEVENRGMNQEGIYRKSGSSTLVKSIQQEFENDVNGPNEATDPDTDIHAVTGCLKQYFRKLPNPLITFEVYDMLLEATAEGTVGEKVSKVKEVFDSLPRTHRDTLEYLMLHLARVLEQQEENLMTPLNLAVVFAPTIMRPSTIERELTDSQAQRNAVQFVLEQHRTIFGGSNGDVSDFA